MSSSAVRRLRAHAGAFSRACRPVAGLLVAACLVIAATGAYASHVTQEGSPVASPAASPAASPVAADLGPSTQIIVGEITVSITDEAIIPVHFESAVGRDVTIHVVNEGTRPHNFSIEEFDIDIDLEPGESATLEIEAPRLGNYRYYSDLPEDEGLEGTMTVFI
ncbi:MAG TPA: cupredoxin domain-containing protein [Thermomicrobiales bacterium]|nr:cupredoxin domain-containing protein [Thermomicrobiales bacterium]